MQLNVSMCKRGWERILYDSFTSLVLLHSLGCSEHSTVEAQQGARDSLDAGVSDADQSDAELFGAQDSSLSPPTFVIEVHGTSTALSHFALLSDDIAKQSPVKFETRQPWPDVGLADYRIQTSLDGKVVAQARLHPFVCAESPNFSQRLEQGWLAVENHQVWLTEAGNLELDTDFEHVLSYGCSWVHPDNRRSSDGTITLTAAPPLCTDEPRRNTQVRIRGSVMGVAIDTSPKTCFASLSDRADGLIQLEFVVPLESFTLSFVMKHCLAIGETFPQKLDSNSSTGCAFQVAASALGQEGKRGGFEVTGAWEISSAEFSKGGRVTGGFSVNFDKGEDRWTAEGAYDLPFIRIPAEGDWHP